MTYENIKTGILTILVVLSGIMTWSIWTYQPTYETLKNGTTDEEVAFSSKRELKKIVRPHILMVHTGGKHYGTTDNYDIDKAVAILGKWKYYSARKYPGKQDNLNETFARQANTEILFPAGVPSEIYRRVLTFEEEKIPKFDFDRIIVPGEAQKQEGLIYFTSSKNQTVYTANVNPSAIEEFSELFQKSYARMDQYFIYQLAENEVYLPEDGLKLPKYTYYSNPLEPEKLKDALFKDPSFVQKSIVTDGEEYMDSSRRMSVNKDSRIIDYVNLLSDNDGVIGTTSLLQKSIDFVNEHSGWTDPYRYVYKDDFNHRVVFRMYTKEGYPIFNNSGISEIRQWWGQSEISKYLRPSFNLELPINPDPEMDMLPSGREAVTSLKEMPKVREELVTNISPGYYMSFDPMDKSLILLEPGWFYEYEGQWQELKYGEGGRHNGLEQD
ncbi:YycH family regulatory protein [Bacillus massilinigeriensis]|uniref:YycH family regulatory protein n=1 Tax=Bacillus mediterraneensis TaxID=1805474 RepID=UPI0008F8DE35|nr:two-component system activity regulator YycH [Bacillus mediterraneensis]